MIRPIKMLIFDIHQAFVGAYSPTQIHSRSNSRAVVKTIDANEIYLSNRLSLGDCEE